MKENNNNDGWQAFWVMLAIGTVIWMILGGIMRCAGIKGKDPMNSDSSWEPRHTQLQKPTQNNVKSLTFIDIPIS